MFRSRARSAPSVALVAALMCLSLLGCSKTQTAAPESETHGSDVSSGGQLQPKVTSSIPGKEVAFKAIYVDLQAQSDASPQVLTTPYETSLESDRVVALFRKVDGEGNLEVSAQLFRGNEPVSQVKATWDVSMIERQGDVVYTTGL